MNKIAGIKIKSKLEFNLISKLMYTLSYSTVIER